MTPHRRRVGLIVFLGTVAILTAALGIARWYFSGPRLARFLVDTLFSNIRGRVEIDSVDWPFIGIASRNLPATIHGLRIYAPDQKTLVLSVDEATAVVDWPQVVFGVHDVTVDNVIVHKAYAWIEQYDVARVSPGDKGYEVGFVAALQGKPRPGAKPGPGSRGPIILLKNLQIRNTDVHLVFPNWNAHVTGVSGSGVLRQSFRNPNLLIPDFTYMLEAHVERGSVEFAKQHFELADIVANRFGQYPYDPHSLQFSATATTMEGARLSLSGKLRELYDPDPWKSSVELRIDAHDGGELLRRLSFGVLAGTRAAGSVEIYGPMPAPQVVAEGRMLELVSSIPVVVEHISGAMDVVKGEIDVGEAEVALLGGRVEAKGRGNLTGSVISSATATVVEPLHLERWLPPEVRREAGSQLTGSADFSYVPPALNVSRLYLSLGRLDVRGSGQAIETLVHSTGLVATLGSDARLDANGTVLPVAGTLDVAARLDARNLPPILERLALPALADSLQASARITGSFAAPTVSGRATALGAPLTPKLETELTYQHAPGGGRLDVRRLVADTLGGGVQGHGTVFLGRRPRLEGVELDASGIDLSAVPGTDKRIAGRGKLSLRASGALLAPRGRLDATLTGLRFDDKALGEARVRARADDRALTVEELHIGDAAGKLDVTGAVGWPQGGGAHRLDLRVMLDGLWLGLIPEPTRPRGQVGSVVADASAAPPGGPPLNLDGRVSADVRLTGTTARPAAAGRVRLAGLAVFDSALGGGTIDLSARPDGRVGFNGRLFQGKIGLDGSVALGGPTGVDARARIALNKLELEELAHELASRVGAHGWASGTIDVRTSPTLAADAHLSRVRFDFDGFDAEGKPNPITVENRGDIVATADYSRMEVRLLQPMTFVSEQGEFTVEGMASESRLATTMRGDVQLRLLELFSRRYIDEARGALTVDVALGGSAVRPTLDGQIGFRDAAVRPRDQESEVKIGSGALVFSLNQLIARGLVIDIDGQKLTLDGTMQLRALQPTTIEARADGRLAGKLLEMIAPRDITHAAGSAAVNVSARGAWANPTFQGQVLFDQRLELAPRALRRELALTGGRVRFSNRDLFIEQVTGFIDEGTFAVRGGATLQPALNAFAHVDVDGVTHRVPGTLEVELAAGIDVTYRGGTVSVSGDLDVVDGRYVQKLRLDRFATDFIVPERTTEISEPFWKASPLLENMQLDVNVRTKGRFLVSNELANLTLDGSLNIRGTPPRPIFQGQVTSVGEGTLTIPGIKIREFAVTDGQVTFSPFREFPQRTPEVLLRAEAPFTDYSGTEHRVYLEVTGTLSGFTWSLRTSTGLNQTQTLSLISTGRTPEEFLGRTRGDAASASAAERTGQYGLITQTSATDEVLKSFSGDVIDTLIADAVRDLLGLDCFSLGVGASSVRAAACKKLGQLVTLTGEYEQGLGFYRYEGNFSLRPTDDLSFVLQGWGLKTVQEVEGVLNSLRLQLEYRFTLR